MNYCIFNIDDRRKRYTDRIRAILDKSFWFNEQPVWTVNGNDPVALFEAPLIHPYRVNWQAGEGPRKGHLGIWYSVLNAIDLNNAPVVTFEDDAILHSDFVRLFWEVTEYLPKDTDAFSLFLPRDQDDVWHKNMSQYSAGVWGIAKAYQVYGGVSMLWTPQGAAKFRALVQRDGIMDQWDNQLYSYARAGEMNVYTQSPNAQILVGISGTEDSIVQETELA